MRVVCPVCKSVNNVPQRESYKKANCGKCKSSLLDTKPVELTNADFDEVVVNSDILVVVDFWAPWCDPCKMMAPNFAKSAANFPLKALYVKVNTENEQNLGARFGIRSIPTIIVFKDAKEVHRVSGALDEATLNKMVTQFI